MLLTRYIQGSTKLSPVDHIGCWNFVLVQKGSNAKKRKLLLHGTPKDCTKFTTQNNEYQKRKSSF